MGNRYVVAFFIAAAACLIGACGGLEEDGSLGLPPSPGGKADTATDRLEARLAALIEVGDILVSSSDEGEECWYLSALENWATRPWFCHAALVVGKDQENGISTLEALNEGQDIQLLTHQEGSLPYETKLAVLRVNDKSGLPLSPWQIQNVVVTAMQWQDVEYQEPPLPLYGDPHETGLYCSMLPFRAYYDATGIKLDAFWISGPGIVPFIVSPDELYGSKHTWVVYEHGIPGKDDGDAAARQDSLESDDQVYPEDPAIP